MRNAIVGQSGGPTSAINATLSGVIKACCKSSRIDKLYGMKNGIEGLLLGEIVDLSYLYEDEKALSQLENTPSSALGSCRKRLPNLDGDISAYEKLLAILEKYDIGYFFYIGGNDSMDTVKKLNEYVKQRGISLVVVGIPKTIDNDLVITDHTPGYGSASKFISTTIKEIACDCSVYRVNAVTIVELMGRDAGWLTAASALPKHFCGLGADLVYLPEVPFYEDKFIEHVKEALKKHPYVVVAVSEGIKYENGEYVGAGKQSGATDAFGHKYLAGTAKQLEALVREKIGCKVRSVELNLPQRCSAHILSDTDINESISIGKYAVRLAEEGQGGKMVTMVRAQGEYKIEYSCVDASQVANKVKLVPKHFINEDGNNVTEECINYIAPLIMGERKISYENGMPVHFRIG
ncbi:MAG: 6-phosphofructokinase [Clostridia bacterium]|nr:6-phosphofructokinase [Clostridia bacterium]